MDIHTQPSPTPQLVAQKIGEQVRRLRKSKRMTKSALAKRAGISAHTITTLESGEGSQTLVLLKILAALNALSQFESMIGELVAAPLIPVTSRELSPALPVMSSQRRTTQHSLNA